MSILDAAFSLPGSRGQRSVLRLFLTSYNIFIFSDVCDFQETHNNVDTTALKTFTNEVSCQTVAR